MSTRTTIVLRDTKQKAELNYNCEMRELTMGSAINGLIDEFNSDPKLQERVQKRANGSRKGEKK